MERWLYAAVALPAGIATLWASGGIMAVWLLMGPWMSTGMVPYREIILSVCIVGACVHGFIAWCLLSVRYVRAGRPWLRYSRPWWWLGVGVGVIAVVVSWLMPGVVAAGLPDIDPLPVDPMLSALLRGPLLVPFALYLAVVAWWPSPRDAMTPTR